VLLTRLLNSLIHKGDLKLTDWTGAIHKFGDGRGLKSHVRISTATAARRILFDPDLAVGECYMDGTFECINGTSIHDFIAVVMDNTRGHGARLFHGVLDKLRKATRQLEQRNTLVRSRKNVAHHYDLNGQLYDLFLDVDRQYSCAYFEHGNATLEEAQLAKKRHLAAKLGIQPGMKVLDIGSGWGGLGLYLAEICDADVTGVTLSQRGLTQSARFLLQDYRKLDQTFDRIVSVGMFEHVGIGHYAEFFEKCHALLKPDGTAVLHSINRSDGPGVTSKWIHKYIFPGGYIPALSEVLPHIEASELYVSDIEILRLHYAETLRHWSQRFANNRDRAAKLYDERFCRMWEFYLAGSECAFRYGGMNNFQIQFVKDQHVLPMTRDYIRAEETRLQKIESGNRHLKMVGP
jgi:cyclopropane-fatty-acyl-phospholipid synthase